MVKDFDTIIFDRPEAFLHTVQWGSFVLLREIERDIALTNLFQTYDFKQENNDYTITLDGLLMLEGHITDFNGSFSIFSIVQSLQYNYYIEFKLFFDCGRLRKASCEDVKKVSINSDKLRHDFNNHIEDLKKEFKKFLKERITLEKKHMQALHEVDMEKFKSEQLIIFNNKLAEEIRNISIIINA